MSATAFAYVLLLRGAEAKDELMALLSQDRRAEVHGVLENVKELPAEQICKQLKELRDSQLKRQRERAKDRIGPQIDHVSPKLYAWLTRIF
jgi:hypothetical protein